MQQCDECGKEISMPYTCNFCGEKYCSEHRLPENHSCGGLSSYKKGVREEGKVYDGPSSSTTARSTSGGGFSLPSIDGVVTYYLLFVIAGVFVAQNIVLYVIGSRGLHQALFVIHPANLEYVWTWVTSIFAHAPFPNLGHILINSLVLFFFGTVLERRIGSRRFLALFLVGGVVAGLSQATAGLLTAGPQTGALGASGAIAAVLGTLTVLNPNLRVYLWFFIPMPLWVLTIAFAGYDLFFAATAGVGAGNVARLAHLSGLALGLAYGWKLKQEGVSVRDRLDFGGGRGPGGPGGGRGRI